jgi:hypothetical protein
MTDAKKAKPRDDGRRASDSHRIGQDRPAHSTATLPDVDILLSRLDRVRQFGKGWSARCPAHDDRQASLSVTIGNDGRILAHCFAGCAIGDVLGAVGLTLTDLFPARIRDDSPDGRRELREAARQAQWRAALGVLAAEATVVSIAAFDVLRGRVSDTDAHRVAVAVERIDAAREVLR